MDDLAVPKRLFEDVVRFLESPLQIAAPYVRAESDVGAGYSLEVFKVRERRCGFERVVDDRRAGLCCGDLIEHRIERLIFDRDQIGRFLRHMWIGCQGHSDRLTGIAHFFERKDRLVVKRRAVVRIWNEAADVLCRDDGVNAFQLERSRRIDLEDLAVWNGTSSDLAVEHSGQCEIVNVFRAAIDLGSAFEPAHRTPDLPRTRRFAFRLRWGLDYFCH